MKRWAKEELEFLKHNYSYIDNNLLSKQINHSVASIVTKVNHHLKLRKVKNCKLCGENITDLAHNAIVCKSCSLVYDKNINEKKWETNKEEM